MFARLGAFGEPFDLVVSGINPGSNVGRAVYHSGTIGACLTARNGNINSIAISQAVHGFGVEGQAWDDMLVGQRWHTAAEVAGVVAESLCGQRFDEPVVVNLNVPNIEVDELHGWRHTSVGREIPRRMSSAVLEPLEGHQGAFRVKMSWGEPVELPDGTDGGTVERQMVSISFLGRINAEQRHDMSMVDESLSRLLGQPR
jgi:5'-nucleotidase